MLMYMHTYIHMHTHTCIYPYNYASVHTCINSESRPDFFSDRVKGDREADKMIKYLERWDC